MRKVILVGVCLSLGSAVLAVDMGINKIPFVGSTPVIDGVADPMWSTVQSYRFDFLWMGEPEPDDPILAVRLARDATNFYGFISVTGCQTSPTDWDEWQIGNYAAVCIGATGRHGLPFQTTDSIVALRHDGIKLCKPDNWSLADVASSAIATHPNSWDGEFAIALTTLGYNGGQTIGLAVVLRQNDANSHPKFVGSVENAAIAIDRPSAWQSVKVASEYETAWVMDNDLKTSPDGTEVQSVLSWHVTDSDGTSFSCQHPLRRGWLEVTCLPDVPCPPKDAIVTHLRGTFATDAPGVRRLFASEVGFFGGLPLVRPIAGNSKALTALSAGLLFSVTGRVTSATAGGFVVDDGGASVSITGSLPPDISVGDIVTVCGACHLGGDGPYLGYTSAIKR